MRSLIKGGRLIDPASETDAVLDILIEDGKVSKIGANLEEAGVSVISAQGKIVCPGLIDIHVHLRSPGDEQKETFATGTRAAVMGGITTLACLPNTNPVIDTQADIKLIHYLRKKEGIISVYPIAALTKELKGEEITEFGGLKEVGAVALCDDSPIMNADTFRRALEYARMFDLPIFCRCEDLNLSKGGMMNEGKTSTLLGLAGIPSVSEQVMIARDLLLAEFTEGRIHICHVSTSASVEMIRQAKDRGVRVTAEVNPHHFTLTEEAVSDYNSNTKVSPPLRTGEDVEALKQGLKNGTLDVIASDHAPHTQNEKEQEFDFAPYGIIGLETLVPLVFSQLVEPGVLTAYEAVKKLTYNPAKIIGVDKGYLKEGCDADITIIDPEFENTYSQDQIVSLCKNTPFRDWTFKGWPTLTMVAGEVVMQDRKLLV